MFQTPTLPESELELTFTKTYLDRCHLEPFYPSAQFDKEPPGQRLLVLRVDPEHRSGQASKVTRSISHIDIKGRENFVFFFGYITILPNQKPCRNGVFVSKRRVKKQIKKWSHWNHIPLVFSKICCSFFVKTIEKRESFRKWNTPQSVVYYFIILLQKVIYLNRNESGSQG